MGSRHGAAILFVSLTVRSTRSLLANPTELIARGRVSVTLTERFGGCVDQELAEGFVVTMGSTSGVTTGTGPLVVLAHTSNDLPIGSWLVSVAKLGTETSQAHLV